MKTYNINIHFDAAITLHGIVADNEETAKKLAYEQASMMNLFCAAMDTTPTTADVVQENESDDEDIKEMEVSALYEFVVKYVSDMAAFFENEDDPQLKKNVKAKLAALAFGTKKIKWDLGTMGIPQGHPLTTWLTDLFTSLANGTHPRQAFYDRCVRMYAHLRFKRMFKNVAKELYGMDTEGLDKIGKKQAVADGLQVLCDKMEEYVMNNDDPDYKGEEPRMVIRYEVEKNDHWNLFVYCTGPNDTNNDEDPDYLALTGVWQHVWYDEDGTEQFDDFDSTEWNTRRECMQYLFYTPGDESNPRPDNIHMGYVCVDN